MQNDNKVATQLLQGSGLIWARAKFDNQRNEPIQVNQWAKITIEIFTKIKGPGIKFERING